MTHQLAVTHHLRPSPAGRVHAVEAGSGPLVLLVHGFPESWYSWRHQIPALAEAGYRVVALDVRGYGRSSKPGAVEAYRLSELVADNVALVHALGERQAVVVGHDWGSPIASSSGLLAPETFRAVGMLSVPYNPPASGPRPTELFAGMGEAEEEFYLSYFQQPGRAEREIEPDVRGWLAGLYSALSAETMAPPTERPPYFVPRGGTMRARFPDRRPAWLDDDALDFYADEFERTGLTGGLNRYRAMDRDWEELTAYAGAPLRQPALFLGGALDTPVGWMRPAVDAFATTLPDLRVQRELPDCGHWIQQEQPAETNRLLVEWLDALQH